MTNILLTSSLTQTTVVSFIQNRLVEFGIDDNDIKKHLYNLSENIIAIVKAHFEYSFHLPTEEDLYYDEVYYICKELLNEIKLIDLKDINLKKLLFIVIKVLDQIIIEAKEQQLTSLAELAIQTEKEILNHS
jgi:hypothetical protein